MVFLRGGQGDKCSGHKAGVCDKIAPSSPTWCAEVLLLSPLRVAGKRHSEGPPVFSTHTILLSFLKKNVEEKAGGEEEL